MCICIFTLKVMKQPWPGMARTIFGDHERFERVYFSKFNGYYTTGDGELPIRRHTACCQLVEKNSTLDHQQN